jgi:hypothetical protein
VRELIENAFDEDATNVLVTVLDNGNVVIEDDAGMNSNSMDKFLILGSPHKAEETLSPKLKRLRTGRYGTGRLSFLTSFDQMKIKTRLDDFNKTITIDGNTLEELITGKAKLREIREPKLGRNGTEILLIGSKISIDINKLSKEIKKLSILKYPLFEVYIKSANNIKEWDMSDSQIIRSPDIQGYKLDVNLDNPRTTGEIIIARRPLGQDEKGIAIMVGNHVVLRSTFGFDNKLSRVTGYVKCDELTSRFADKSALIENDTYNAFNQNVKTFIIDQVLPSLTEYEDVLITREESKIYKEIDKVMGQAVLETLEPVEEIQGFESVEVSSPAGENGTDDSSHTNDNLTANPYSIHGHENDKTDNVSFTLTQVDGNNDVENEDDNSKRKFDSDLDDLNGKKTTKTYSSDNYIDNRGKILSSTEISNSANEFALNDPSNRDKESSQVSSNDYRDNLSNDNNGMIRKTIRKPILKKTFTLKKIGYKVIPYEDETDPRYSFTNENIVFVNKAHSTYKVEAQRGDEFLFRHITNIVAEVVVGSKYPEAKDILEIQNKLISEAIKIHDYSMLKK